MCRCSPINTSSSNGIVPTPFRQLSAIRGVDVVYEGMMASSIDDGGLEFRGTNATLKLNRSGFGVYHEGVPAKDNPVVKADSFRDGTIDHMQNFFDCIKSRKEPNAPVEAGVAAAAPARSPIWPTAAPAR